MSAENNTTSWLCGLFFVGTIVLTRIQGIKPNSTTMARRSSHFDRDSTTSLVMHTREKRRPSPKQQCKPGINHRGSDTRNQAPQTQHNNRSRSITARHFVVHHFVGCPGVLCCGLQPSTRVLRHVAITNVNICVNQ